KRDKVYRFVTRINKSALPHNATGTVRLYKVELMSTPILRNPPPPTQSRGALAGITSGAEPLTLPTGPQVALYPNPTEGTFTLASSGKGAVNLRIFSALGQSVYHQTITPQHDQWQITLSAEELGLRPGMYQVWWQQGDYRKSLPLMIR
ncbi:MAG: T9SS type A sorting domain-containing protein, partial [Bacteroidota bacterium]